jgi:hypothetical protein
MEKITLKEFTNLLTTKESIYLSSIRNSLELDQISILLKEKEKEIKEITFNDKLIRKALEHSRSLEFINLKDNSRSWLDFNQKGKKSFYKDNNILIYKHELESKFNKYNYIIYHLKG